MANQTKYGIVGYMAPDWEVEKWIDEKGKPTTIKKDHYNWKTKVMLFINSLVRSAFWKCSVDWLCGLTRPAFVLHYFQDIRWEHGMFQG